MRRRIRYIWVLLAAISCTKNYSSYQAQVGAPKPALQSLADYLVNDYNFSLFYGALKRTGLYQALATDTAQLTLLVPDNDAFARAGISADSLATMDTASLRSWMAYHIVKGAVTYASVPQTIGNQYFTLSGRGIYFSKPLRVPSAPVLHINGDTVDDFDLAASNGVIQVLNTPLSAPYNGTVQQYLSAPQFSLFDSLLVGFHLWDTLATLSGAQTVFAPTNAAFAAQYGYYYGSTQQNIIFSLTIDSIRTWENEGLPRDLFALYILPARIFTTDPTDAPPVYGTYYILPAGDIGISIGPGNQGGVLFSATLITVGTDIAGYYLYNNEVLLPGGGGLLTTPVNTVMNNNVVVQALSSLVVVPVTPP